MNDAATILADLLASGITPAVTSDGRGIEVPAGKLTQAQREAILNHKAELIARIQASARITVALLEAAMRVCDAWNDSDATREQMRQDVLQTPQHLRADLLDHFNKNETSLQALVQGFKRLPVQERFLLISENQKSRKI